MSILRWVVKSNSTLPNDATAGASTTEVHVSANHLQTCSCQLESLQSPTDMQLPIGEPPTTFIELPEMETTKANITSEVNVKAANFVLPECPNQRTFPSWSSKQRWAFSPSWYCKYPWLHNVEAKDCVLCFYCMVADKRALMMMSHLSLGFPTGKMHLRSLKIINTQNLIVKQCCLYQFQELPGMLENF